MTLNTLIPLYIYMRYMIDTYMTLNTLNTWDIKSHTTYRIESCHTFEWVMLHMSHIWMSHVTHVTNLNELRHTWMNESRVWSHVTHLNESRHTRNRAVSAALEKNASDTHCTLQQHTATHYNTLQHTNEIGLWEVHSKRMRVMYTAHCNHTLQHAATHERNRTVRAALGSNEMIAHCILQQQTAAHWNTLPHTAAHYNTLQHTKQGCQSCTRKQWDGSTLRTATTHCNTLQHTKQGNQSCTQRQWDYSTLHTATPHCNTLQHAAWGTSDLLGGTVMVPGTIWK